MLLNHAQFTLNWLGTNLDLSFLIQYGATVNQVSAYEINPAAGSETQLIKTSYLEATRCLVEKGIKVTQERLAALVGKAQSTISENLNRWGVTLDALAVLALKIIGSPIDTLYRPPDNPDYRDFLGLDPLEEVAAAIEAIAALGFDGYLTQIFNYFPKPLQLKLLGYLIATTKIPPPE
jgi:transcriptional regulator with XRE-family HTH domain